ncbi:MAG: hypothetical protein ACI4QA_01420 [Candidatus Spyradosoma sp.]
MTPPSKNSSTRDPRARRFGIALLVGFVVLLAFVAQTWFVTSYRARERFALYFPQTVQGLSAGADVLADGRKIGQVESVGLRRVERGGDTTHYALVTIFVDVRRVMPHAPESMSREEVRERLDRAVEAGLRARLMMPSPLANGLSVELFLDAAKPVRLARDDGNDLPEIPTIPGSASEIVDGVNAFFEKYKPEEIPRRFEEAKKHLREVNEILEEDAVTRADAALVRALEALNRALDAEAAARRVKALDDALAALADALESGEGDSAALRENAETALRDFSAQLRDAADAFRATTETLDGETLRKVENALRDLRETLSPLRREIP